MENEDILADTLGRLCATYIRQVRLSKSREIALDVKERIERSISNWEPRELPFIEKVEHDG